MSPKQPDHVESLEILRELDRRVEEIRLGKVKPVPGEVVMKKLKARITQGHHPKH